MLQKIKTSRKSKFKYLLLLPLLAFMLGVASCASKKTDSKATTEEVLAPPPRPKGEDKNTIEKMEIEAIGSDSPESVPFSVVETVPTLPGCEGDTNLEDCVNSKIQEHIGNNFNTALGKELGLEGLQRITVMFIINTSGGVTDVMVRGPHKELEDEAKRVVELLPKFIPGKTVDGKKIGVNYTLPIRFEVQ